MKGSTFAKKAFWRTVWGGGVYIRGGRDTLHRDTALLIPAGMWVLVGEFLSIACSVQWASDWHQILVLFHPHCPILIFLSSWLELIDPGNHKNSLLVKAFIQQIFMEYLLGGRPRVVSKRGLVPLPCCWQPSEGVTPIWYNLWDASESLGLPVCYPETQTFKKWFSFLKSHFLKIFYC